ncbi:hypothetical protein [Planktothrix agardhii]|jgi:hypothetical protein|uniref:hypothetical protein n=1 Tax=Planktothrix agardhii TaxID=1160 RepID=UPI001D0B87EA|nr:hypothetical protein [Planktothrix agardhii]MCB8789041.1 hypothetical protein [Planktothrix agardhii 1025]MCF3614171.1 hypothetical protein [Planktothrix agardhii 1027]
MNIVLLEPGDTKSLVPLLTIIEHHPDSIVGCILMPTDVEQPPDWFLDSYNASNLLDCVNKKMVLENVSAFLIIREPNSFLQLSVLAAISCFNFNYSGTGGTGGKKLLEVLAKHKIRTYPSHISLPFDRYSSKSLREKNEQIKTDFEQVWGGIAYVWLPDSWGLEPVSC